MAPVPRFSLLIILDLLIMLDQAQLERGPSTGPSCLIIPGVGCGVRVGHLSNFPGGEEGWGGSPTYLAGAGGGWEGVDYLSIWMGAGVGAPSPMNRMTDTYENITFLRTTYVIDKDVHCTLQISSRITDTKNILSTQLP